MIKNKGLDTLQHNLREIRLRKNLTVKRLSELSGISESSIVRYETLKSDPNIEIFYKLTKALDVKIEWKVY